MSIKDERVNKQEENQQFIDNQESLIWAMFDAGYRIEEIAKQLKIPQLIVKLNLGEAQVVSA